MRRRRTCHPKTRKSLFCSHFQPTQPPRGKKISNKNLKTTRLHLVRVRNYRALSLPDNGAAHNQAQLASGAPSRATGETRFALRFLIFPVFFFVGTRKPRLRIFPEQKKNICCTIFRQFLEKWKRLAPRASQCSSKTTARRRPRTCSVTTNGCKCTFRNTPFSTERWSPHVK